MTKNKYQLAMSPTTDIFIEFTTGISGKWVSIYWCRGTERREEFDVVDWFDGHDIPRSFEISGDSIYEAPVAREIWNALVNHHKMTRVVR